ncbi:MAG: DUF5343 domain-containing protein [Actinomycetia bacterium]|nr:DUF5343 domain-containing protein [Actinomycetes bacterium]
MESRYSESSPPYNIPWTTFVTTVERIAANPPSRVDRSHLGSQSGNVQTYTIAALKAFGLIDEDARPTRLNEFSDPGTRKRKMGDLLKERYPTLVELGTSNTTSGELSEAFGAAFLRLNGESRTKAIRFFLSGMAYVELPTSSLWSVAKAPRGASSRTGARKPPARKAGGGQSDAASAANRSASGHTRTVTLRSGGTVTMTYDVNMFEATAEDQEFVMGLINELRDYPAGGPATSAAVEGGAS